jgi:hypothetical protein
VTAKMRIGSRKIKFIGIITVDKCTNTGS